MSEPSFYAEVASDRLDRAPDDVHPDAAPGNLAGVVERGEARSRDQVQRLGVRQAHGLRRRQHAALDGDFLQSADVQPRPVVLDDNREPRGLACDPNREPARGGLAGGPPRGFGLDAVVDRVPNHVEERVDELLEQAPVDADVFAVDLERHRLPELPGQLVGGATEAVHRDLERNQAHLDEAVVGVPCQKPRGLDVRGDRRAGLLGGETGSGAPQGGHQLEHVVDEGVEAIGADAQGGLRRLRLRFLPGRLGGDEGETVDVRHRRDLRREAPRGELRHEQGLESAVEAPAPQRRHRRFGADQPSELRELSQDDGGPDRGKRAIPADDQRELHATGGLFRRGHPRGGAAPARVGPRARGGGRIDALESLPQPLLQRSAVGIVDVLPCFRTIHHALEARKRVAQDVSGVPARRHAPLPQFVHQRLGVVSEPGHRAEPHRGGHPFDGMDMSKQFAELIPAVRRLVDGGGQLGGGADMLPRFGDEQVEIGGKIHVSRSLRPV